MTGQAGFTAGDWHRVHAAEAENASRRECENLITLLAWGTQIVDGFAVTQLEHALQVAHLAEQAGADDELILVAIVHDAGKALSLADHPAVIAEIMRAHVSQRAWRLLRFHSDHLGQLIEDRKRMSTDPDARRLAQWDSQAVTPTAPSMPWEAAVHRVRDWYTR